MNLNYQLLPLLSILMLMLHGFTLPLYKRKSSVYRNSLLMGFGLVLLNLASFVGVLKNGAYIFNVGHYPQPYGIALRIGSVEAVLALVFAFVYGLILWFSKANLKHEIDENRIGTFYTLGSLLMASLLGIIYTYDLFTAFVFIEVSTLASCGLIAIKDKRESIKATIKYMILSGLSSGLFLLGIALLYGITGHLSMSYIHDELALQAAGHPDLVLISLILFTFGLAIKSALFPLHVWLPDAHTNAPTVTSAILSSLVIKAPVFLLIKIYYLIYGFELIQTSHMLPVLLTLGAFAMIMGSLFARNQKTLKRMVAYSSVAQMGYIFLGIGLGSTLGLAMALYQTLAHALTKSALFMTAGVFIDKTGFTEIEDLNGVGKKMPITLGIFALCGLSMVGIPVLPGFINKWNLAIAAIDAGKLGLLFIILASSLLNATYYFPIIINGYFGEGKFDSSIFDTKTRLVRELAPILILGLSIGAAGLFSGTLIDWLMRDFFILK